MTNAYNFSRVSQRDAIAFGSARPAFPAKDATREQITGWIDFMKANNIKHVLSLLGDDETAYYNFDIDNAMRDAFGQQYYTRTSVFKEGAKDIMCNAVAAAADRKEAIVIHCSGGEGRAALGMGLWLVQTYGLAPEDAAREVQEETDRNEGINRKVNHAKLKHLVVSGSMIGFSK